MLVPRARHQKEHQLWLSVLVISIPAGEGAEVTANWRYKAVDVSDHMPNISLGVGIRARCSNTEIISNSLATSGAVASHQVVCSAMPLIAPISFKYEHWISF